MPDASLAQSQPRPFFNRTQGATFDVRAHDGVTEIDLYEEIGFWGVTAAEFKARLRGAGDVRLRINSPGGDVFDGITMHNDLVDHPGNVAVEIVGIAASAAAIVAMAGGTIRIAGNAFMLIHKAWTPCLGDEAELRRVADVLAAIDRALAATYAARTGKTEQAIAELMAAETWLSGQSAVDVGFADEIAELPEAQARFDLAVFRNPPAALAAPVGAKPRTFRDYERLLTQDARLPRSEARALLRRAFPGDAPQGAGDADFVAAMLPYLRSLRAADEA